MTYWNPYRDGDLIVDKIHRDREHRLERSEQLRQRMERERRDREARAAAERARPKLNLREVHAELRRTARLRAEQLARYPGAADLAAEVRREADRLDAEAIELFGGDEGQHGC